MTTLGTGNRGKFIVGYRLAIDGAPYQPVSSRRLATETPSFPSVVPSMGARLPGLVMTEASISSSVDIMTAKLNADGIDFEMIDGGGAVWSRLFQIRPAHRTYLRTSITESATGAMTVASTSGFASSGYLWIDQECMHYSAIGSGTTFTLDARGSFGIDGGTLSAQAHYYVAGATRAPLVTDWPITWEGRRVSLFVYERGDDLTGDGTQVWRGVVTASPRFDGIRWRLSCDSIAAVLEGRFGGDLGSEITPRGVHYYGGFQLAWAETASTVFAISDPTASGTVTMAPAYYETNDDWCSALEADLQADMTAAGADGTAYVVSEGNVGWHIEYELGGTARRFSVQFPPSAVVDTDRIDMPLGVSVIDVGTAAPAPVASFTDWGTMTEADGTLPGFTSTRYYLLRQTQGYDPALGGVPRGQFLPFAATSTDQLKLRLDAVNGLPGTPTSIALDAGDDRGGTTSFAVGAVDSTNNIVTVLSSLGLGRLRPLYSWVGTSMTVRLGQMTQGRIGDLLDYVVAQSPALSALGMMPPLRAADIDSAAFNAANTFAPLRNRIWTTFPAKSLTEILAGECLALGLAMGLDSMGRLIPIVIQFAAPYEAGAKSIARSELITSGDALMQRELHGIGLVSQVEFSTGYDDASDQFTGPTVTVRSVEAYAQSAAVRSIKIEQYSRSFYQHPTPTQILGGVASMIDTLTGEYAIDTLRTVRTDIYPGDRLGYTWPTQFGGLRTGTITPGVDASSSIVIGRKADAFGAEVELTLLVSTEAIAGYAQGDLLTSWSLVSGATWDVVVSEDTADASVWLVGDYVRVRLWDSATLTTINGAISAVTGTTIRVDLVGAWVPGASSWVLEQRGQSGSGSPRQRTLAFWAGSDGVFAWSGQPAEQYAP